MPKKKNLSQMEKDLAAPTAAKPSTKEPSDMAVLRKLYPLIVQKREGGSGPVDIVNWLNRQGMEIRLDTYQVYMSRLRREHGHSKARTKLTVQVFAPVRPLGQTNEALPTHVVSPVKGIATALVSESGKQEGSNAILNLKRTMQANPDETEREANAAASRLKTKLKQQKERK